MGANTNFATWNSRHYQGGSSSTTTFSEGNCRVGTTSGGYPLQYSNFAFPTSGKWYIELNNIVNNDYHVFGISRQQNIRYGNALLNQTGSYQYQAWNGKKRGNGGSEIAYGSSWTAVGDVIGLAFDADNGKIWWAKNGTWQASGDPANGSNEAFSGLDASETYYFGWSDYYTNQPGTVHINCGQDSSFSNSKTSGSANAADGNGFGDFYYAPPSGFLALGSANLPISDDIDPAQTNSNYPTKNFGIVKYTGTGSSQAITGLGFKPDLIWIKQRNGSGHNVLTDSTRGVTKQLEITDTEGGAQPAESTNTDGLTAFGTDGFTVGGDAEYNGNTNTYVAWCWRAGEGTTSTNTNGTTNSTVQANQAAGFSIVSYTGTGSAMTVGHGLSAAPNFTIIKDRSNAANWIAFYDVEDGSLDYMFPNAYTGKANSSLTGPNSSIWNFSASDSYSNTSSRNYIMYAWHNVEGYQKFGTYEGNNIDNNGPFVYTGFRPRLLVLKGIDENYGWYVFDSERSTSNLVDDNITWFPGGAETSEPTGARKVDFLSNGFKVMADAASINGDADTYLYMCWGDVPFKYNNTF